MQQRNAPQPPPRRRSPTKGLTHITATAQNNKVCVKDALENTAASELLLRTKSASDSKDAMSVARVQSS